MLSGKKKIGAPVYKRNAVSATKSAVRTIYSSRALYHIKCPLLAINTKYKSFCYKSLFKKNIQWALKVYSA